MGAASGVGEAAIEEMVAVAAVATGARVFPREGLAGAKNSRSLPTALGEAPYPVRLRLLEALVHHGIKAFVKSHRY